MIARAQWPFIIDRRVIGKIVNPAHSGVICSVQTARAVGETEEVAFDRNARALSELDAQFERSPAGRFLLVIPVPVP